MMVPTPTKLDERVARLETGLTNLSTEVSSLVRGIESLRGDLGSVGRPDWAVIIAGIFLIMALGSAALVPVYQRASYAEALAQGTVDWQRDYSRGLIPSSAEPKLAAIDKMFAEVETQFRSFKERMIENEGQMVERARVNTQHIEENLAVVSDLRDRTARLEERGKLLAPK